MESSRSGVDSVNYKFQSCPTIGLIKPSPARSGWSYNYKVELKPEREIVHLFQGKNPSGSLAVRRFQPVSAVAECAIFVKALSHYSSIKFLIVGGSEICKELGTFLVLAKA
ncbi:hypothetical protein ACU8KH_02566 [Lachancea thermotolerans]